MKKYKNLVLASVLSMSLLNPAFILAKENKNINNAETKNVSEDSVKGELENIKKIFNISNDYEFFNISRVPIDNYTGNKFLEKLTKDSYITNYEWTDDKLGSINVSINSNGDLVNYSNIKNKDYENLKTKENVSKKDAEVEVLKVLNEAIKNFDKKFAFSKYSIDRYTGNQIFTYVRSLNNVVFVDQKIQVTFSPYEKKVTNISTISNYGDSISFVEDSNFKKDDKIGLAKAKEIFTQESPLKLSYLINEDNSKRVYFTEIPNINARTGEIEKIDKISYYSAKETAKDEASDNLSQVEKKKLQGLKNLAPQSEAKKIAKEIIGDDYKVKSFGTYTYDKVYTYDIRLVKGESQADVILNAKNLDLITLSNYESSKPKSKLSKAEVKKIAIDLTRDYTNTNDLNFKIAEVTMYDDYAEVFIPRYVYTRPVIGDGITVEVNYDKNINYFSRNFSDVEFNKEKLNFSEKEANYIYFGSKDFGLKYQMTDEGPKLYYGSVNSINPVIGEDKILRDENENIVNFKDQIKYEDLNKAKDKDIINYMTDAGFGIVNKNLQDKVTYKEFVNLLENYNSDVLKQVGESYGIKNLEKIKDKNILEKDAVKAIVYYQNLNKFTEAKDIFKDDVFKDQKSLKDYENYYIVAKGFGLIDENINPDNEMTLEEILYLINKTM